MNILILNWRDPKNPRSGGAEKVTFKYAQHWAGLGHKVTWVCNTFPGCRAEETDTGVRFVRLGPALGFTVFQLLITFPLFLINAVWYSSSLLRHQKFDLVVDEIHGLPFFSPLYSRVRNVLWVCEVAGPIWDIMYPFPVNVIGKILEKLIYFIYHRTEIWAISQSTRRDILAIVPAAQVKVIPLGVEAVPLPNIHKNKYPSAVFLARLVKMKGVETVMFSAKKIASVLPEYKLYMIGSGPQAYIAYLQGLAARLGISDNVEFLGRLSDSDRNKILARSHFLIHPSYKEGFGLTILEAGLAGTPAIARSGSSLDELVINGRTGLIFETEDQIPDLFIKCHSGSKYQSLSRHAQKYALRFTWDRILPKSGQVTLINSERR